MSERARFVFLCECRCASHFISLGVRAAAVSCAAARWGRCLRLRALWPLSLFIGRCGADIGCVLIVGVRSVLLRVKRIEAAMLGMDTVDRCSAEPNPYVALDASCSRARNIVAGLVLSMLDTGREEILL